MIETVFVLVSLAATAAASPPPAPESDEPVTPMLEGELQPHQQARVTGWYLAPTSGFTTVGGEMGYLVGLRAVVMLDRRLGVGVAGTAVATNEMALGARGPRESGAYGGIYLQYGIGLARRLHAYADTTIGMGTWCAAMPAADCRGEDFVLVEPTLNAELDLTGNVKLALGLGYRAAIAEREPDRSRRNLSGVVGRASLVLGVF
jgi:hypothetical protein